MLAVAVVIAVVWWDEHREAQATLAAMAQTQELLARSLARAGAVETPGELLVLRSGASAEQFVTADGRVFFSPRIAAAIAAGEQTLVVPREEAVRFGFPERRAIAAIASAADGPLIVISTAQRERDRQTHALVRVVAAVLIVSMLVMVFGRRALREQKRILSSERDAQLARADKLATMAAIAGGVAHEVATPLGVITQRAEQLSAKANDERSTRAVATILEQASHIERVMRGFLALSRGQRAEAVPVALADVARDATELVRHRFESADVALAVNIADRQVLGDRVLLTHAVVNLLLNACEASPPGASVQFDVGATISVVDQGPGIDDATAQRLCEPFFTTKATGSGLGLAIVREVAAHHGGDLRIAAIRPGVGTRAVMTLPVMQRTNA